MLICPKRDCETCKIKREVWLQRNRFEFECNHYEPHEPSGGCDGDRCDITTPKGYFKQEGCRCVLYHKSETIPEEMFEV